MAKGILPPVMSLKHFCKADGEKLFKRHYQDNGEGQNSTWEEMSPEAGGVQNLEAWHTVDKFFSQLLLNMELGYHVRCALEKNPVKTRILSGLTGSRTRSPMHS
jgi:hypothetical protein